MGVQGRHNRGLEGSWTGPGCILSRFERLDQFLMIFWWVLRASCGETVANMGPTSVPRWSQNQWKMRSKINQIFNAFWNRFFMRFWWIFCGKMEASWHQHRSKIDVQFGKRCFEKTSFFWKKNQYFWRFWRSKLGRKIDQKSIRKWVQHRKVSWHRFLKDFGGFWDPTWESKSIKSRCQKTWKKWAKLKSVRGAKIMCCRGPERSGGWGPSPAADVRSFKR